VKVNKKGILEIEEIPVKIEKAKPVIARE